MLMNSLCMCPKCWIRIGELLSQVLQLYKAEQTVEAPDSLASYPKVVHADFTAVQVDNYANFEGPMGMRVDLLLVIVKNIMR